MNRAELGGAIAAVVIIVAIAITASLLVVWKNAPSRTASTKIPKNLFVTGPWAFQSIPKPIRAALQSWKRHGPSGLQVHWFDEPAREAWVAKHFPQFLDDYRSLVPGTYQADLWRVLVLFVHGGVYTDAGTVLKAPLWSVFQDAQLAFARDRNPRDVFTKVIGAVKGHPVLLQTAQKIINNIRGKVYGSNSLAPTGPVAFGDVFRDWFWSQQELLAPDADNAFPLDIDGNWRIGKFGQTRIFYFQEGPEPHFIRETMNPDARLLWQNKVTGYKDIMYTNRNAPTYGQLWNERKIYRSVPKTQTAIPSRLFVTGPFPVHELPESIRQNLDTWRKHGPSDLSIHWFDDAAAEAWIKTEYPQYLDDYNVLVPGAYKADLWRLLVIYTYGGVYADAGLSLLEPIWDMFRAAPLMLVHDRVEIDGRKLDRMLWQGLFGAVAGHPVIKSMIDKVVQNIRARSYGKHLLDITGPLAVDKAAAHAFGKARMAQLVNSKGNWIPGHHGDVLLFGTLTGKIIFTAGNQDVIDVQKNKEYRNVMYESRRVPQYAEYWLRRQVYKVESQSGNVPGDKDAALQLTIPKVLHFMWGLWDTGPVPTHVTDQIAAWRASQPDFVVKVWTKDTCEALLRAYYPEWVSFYKAAPRRVMCADLIRYLILHHEGGWYLDVDCVPQAAKGLSALSESNQFVAFVEHDISAKEAMSVSKEPIRRGQPELQRRIANYAIGSVEKHALWDRVMASIMQRWTLWLSMAADPTRLTRDYDILFITGPDVLTDSIAAVNKNITIIPKHVAIKIVVHDHAGTWRVGKDAGRDNTQKTIQGDPIFN